MTDYVLTEPELRVLGSLVEKEITTPEYYPLTLNSLVNACNQKTNREPVTDYGECVVSEATESLAEKGLVVIAADRNGRVPKYENYFAHELRLSPHEVAVMCVLMLRGPQTVGELRGRTERMHQFGTVEEVEAVLEALAAREDGQLAVKLPRQPGHKESRYAHLLGGEVAVEFTGTVEGSNGGMCAEAERLAKMEGEIASIRAELQEIREQFLAFKAEFE